MKWLLITAASLTALVLGLITLFLLGLSTGWVGLMVGMAMALLPLPFYMVLIFWIDRFEKEPLWMLTSALLWGATVAIFFAYILNTIFARVVQSAFASYAGVATAVISAPLIEEVPCGSIAWDFARQP
jgi:RsiW-degrading membrane proteinase PrsW (M82 family)